MEIETKYEQPKTVKFEWIPILLFGGGISLIMIVGIYANGGASVSQGDKLFLALAIPAMLAWLCYEGKKKQRRMQERENDRAKRVDAFCRWDAIQGSQLPKWLAEHADISTPEGKKLFYHLAAMPEMERKYLLEVIQGSHKF